MPRKENIHVDLRLDPRFRNIPSNGEQETFRQELVAFRHDPDTLQEEEHGDSELARIRRLLILGWSYKSVSGVTGLSVEQLRAWRRGGQAKEEIEALLNIRLSKA